MLCSCLLLTGCDINVKHVGEGLNEALSDYTVCFDNLEKQEYAFSENAEVGSSGTAVDSVRCSSDDTLSDTLSETSFDNSTDAAQQDINPEPTDNNDYPAEDGSAAVPTFSDLAPTTRMSFAELVGDNGIYTYPEGFPEPGTYRIVVDLKYQLVMVYTRDETGAYTVPVRYMRCSTGSDATSTPTGTFTMPSYRVRFALFKDTSVYGQYWSQITGRIYFHSILYSEKDADTYTTTSYNNLGSNVSHGCIRLTVPDARWIWYNAAPGTEVEVRKGSSADNETAAISEQLILAQLPDKRQTGLTGDIPYTDNWKIEDVPHEVDFVQGSQ